MDELIAFLRARLDEDEQVARSADDGKLHIIEASFPPLEEHMMRWSSARVLRDVEAKRLLLACAEDDINVEKPVDKRILTDRQKVVLRALALPYSDHPDYREEWRP